MKRCVYTTKAIADSVGIHVNTVRFYEEIGFITPPVRNSNGYRIYSELQRQQCKLIRTAMRAEVLQNGLRKKAVDVVRLCAALDFDRAYTASEEYRDMIDGEIIKAKAAIEAVDNALLHASPEAKPVLKRQEAARAIAVTSETLRTWERNGLIAVHRSENGYRVYTAADMERLNIIRTLRCANYSLSSVLRLLNQLDRTVVASIEAILNTPDREEDIISVCDRLIVSLIGTKSDALEVMSMIVSIKENFSTLQ